MDLERSRGPCSISPPLGFFFDPDRCTAPDRRGLDLARGLARSQARPLDARELRGRRTMTSCLRALKVAGKIRDSGRLFINLRNPSGLELWAVG